MRTPGNMVIMCLISALAIRSGKAQITTKMNYQTADKIISLSISRLDTGSGCLKTSMLNRLGSDVFIWTDHAKKTGSAFNVTNRNYNKLLYNPTLLNCENNGLTGKIFTIEGHTTVIYYIPQLRVTRKSVIDLTGVYYYPLKRTNEPVLTDSRLYRIAGCIIPRMLQFSYPGAYPTLKYPQSCSTK
jgi:hypothetical protein